MMSWRLGLGLSSGGGCPKRSEIRQSTRHRVSSSPQTGSAQQLKGLQAGTRCRASLPEVTSTLGRWVLSELVLLGDMHARSNLDSQSSSRLIPSFQGKDLQLQSAVIRRDDEDGQLETLPPVVASTCDWCGTLVAQHRRPLGLDPPRFEL
ncbi:hypothetical protein N7539_004364 [Penicillium diatomitis]|uniref:Uncharacterized protein n=1 Tax=Penicillium diatomitis TaxID=2819901 RepID=A0A9W9XDN8_9EURO|nr:uncharacterized protein N7539_004364 [Penicillium diatomitis]KAJ5489474.1 hypothetical protein N7539_004364 [Penicillium diatomitis]